MGLYDQCVTVRLADGRIIEQNIYPGETHCKYGVADDGDDGDGDDDYHGDDAVEVTSL